MALRSSRPVKVLIATGIAAATIGMAMLPAAASSPRSSEWWMGTLSIRDAWPVSRGAGITIAVLSDGVDMQQPDVTGPRFTTGPDYTGTRQGSGQYFGAIGTGVAALIAAHGYGLQGQSGVIGEVPLANILSVRVTLPPGDPLLAQPAVAARLPGAIAQGIRYAVSHGASVIDLPVDPGQAGITGSGGAPAAARGSAAEAAAVKYALSRNVVLVAPAGDNNLGSDAPNYPAAYPGVIAVGAFDKAFVKAPWSSHQRYVTVTAAGSGMTVATNTGSFKTASSTTYASAAVTGIVAMIQGRFPGITVAQVRQALIKGTVYHGTSGRADGSGYGTVNADKALTVAESELAPASGLAGTGAQPAAALSAPAAQSTHQSLMHSIVRAAVISAGLLAILLVLIALYASRARRRAARQRDAIAADWSRQGLARHPRAGGAEADRMAEFFAAPLPGPAASAAGRPASRALSPSAAEGVFTGAGRPAPVSRDPFGASPAPAPHAGRDAADAGTRSPVGPASKAVARRPAVSGAPPWEEAPLPVGELPWASPAGKAPAAGRHSAPQPAETARDVSPAASAGPAAPPETGDLWDRAAPSAADGYQLAAQQAGYRRADFRQQSDTTNQPDAYEPAGYQRDQYPGAAEPAARASGTGFTPVSQPGTGQPADQPAETTTGQPAETGRPGQSMTGRLDWGREPAADTPPYGSSFSSPPPEAPGGPLPVRQPRQSAPPAALSPSGSLWERAAEPAGAPADVHDSAGRPIYVWDPPAGGESFPGEQSELAPERAERELKGRPSPPGYH